MLLADEPGGNHAVYNIYFMLEFGLLGALVIVQWPLKPLAPIVALVNAVYICALLMEVRTKNGFTEMATVTYITGALILCAAFMGLLFRLASTSLEPLWRSPWFWLFLSLVLYFGGTIPFNGFLVYLSKRDLDMALRFVSINEVLSVVRYTMCAAACLMFIPSKPATI